MQVEELIEKSLVEAEELNSYWCLYTSDEMERLRETIKGNAEGVENISVSDYVDMCTTLARI